VCALCSLLASERQLGERASGGFGGEGEERRARSRTRREGITRAWGVTTETPIRSPSLRSLARQCERTRERETGVGEGDGDRNRGTKRTTDREKGRNVRARNESESAARVGEGKNEKDRA
jgi:hypothetical protein